MENGGDPGSSPGGGIMQQPKTIATHSGKFHTDDVFALAVLTTLYPEVKVVRTRDPKELEGADLRVDVGGKYDSKTGDFDHHQPDFIKRHSNGLPYASAGLVWDEFGKQLVANDEAFVYIKKVMVYGIDARDNGVALADFTSDVRLYDLTNLTASFYPSWEQRPRDYDAQFLKAVAFMQELLKRELVFANGIAKAREKVLAALKESAEEYVILEPPTPPWMYTLTEESDKMFVVYEYSDDGRWGVQCIPMEHNTFKYRKRLPQQWSAKSGKELQEETGVSDAIFCHKACFMCVAGSKEGALALVKKAIVH